jgi:hypothetical protein
MTEAEQPPACSAHSASRLRTRGVIPPLSSTSS